MAMNGSYLELHPPGAPAHCSSHGLRPVYVGESLTFAVCVATLFEVLSAVVLPAVLSRRVPHLPQKQQKELTARALGSFHAVISTAGALYTTFADAAWQSRRIERH